MSTYRVSAVKEILWLVVLIAVVLAILAFLGLFFWSYIVHIFLPESWHWMSERQLERLPFL